MLGIHKATQLGILGLISISLLTPAVWAQTGKGGGMATVTDDEQSEARARYARGLQLVKEGNYQAALIEMQRAYVLNPSYKIQYNLGQIQAHLGDVAAAVDSYERYLSEGGGDVPPPRAFEVAQEIGKLRSRVGSVDLNVKGEGADVLVDDVVIGRSPFRKKFLVNIGKHRFSAVRAGAEPVARVIAIAGEDSISLELDVSGPVATKSVTVLTPPSSSTLQTTPRKPEPSQSATTTPVPASDAVQVQKIETTNQASSGRRLTWLGWTITGTLAAGAIVAGLIARNEANDLGRLRDSPKATRHDLDSAQTSTFRAALITDVLLGATAIAAGFSLYYTLVPGRPAAKTSINEASGFRLTFSPNGVRIHHSF
jgi:hypothetical protein